MTLFDPRIAEELQREALADAWDAGYAARRSEDHRSPGEANPYRETA